MKLNRTLALVAAAAVACGDPAGPPGGETTPVSFPICEVLGFTWFAYQNQGGQWTQITPANGHLTFDATEKVSIAMAISESGHSFTQITNATAAELNAVTTTACYIELGNRTMTGTVTGVAAGEFTRISGEVSVDGATLVAPSWELENLPTTPVDIVATRYTSFSAQPANRVFVRRSVTASGAIGALDFAGNESAALESTITTIGGLTGGTLYFTAAVLTANGTMHELAEMQTPVDGASASISTVSLPAALRVASDQHMVISTASDAQGTRSLTHYYKTPANKTLDFGPMVGTPTVTTVASSPYVRPRAQLGGQAAYPSGVIVQWNDAQGQTKSSLVSILTTSGYAGAGDPQAWDVTMPDMTSGGYESAWGMQSTNYAWAVTAFSAPGSTPLISGLPVDGATITSATRTSVQGASSVLRHGHFPVPTRQR